MNKFSVQFPWRDLDLFCLPRSWVYLDNFLDQKWNRKLEFTLTVSFSRAGSSSLSWQSYWPELDTTLTISLSRGILDWRFPWPEESYLYNFLDQSWILVFEVSPTQVRDQTKTVLRMVTEQNIAIAYLTVCGNTYVNLTYTLENSRNEGNPYFGINFASIFPLILSQFWHFCVAFDVFRRFFGPFFDH